MSTTQFRRAITFDDTDSLGDVLVSGQTYLEETLTSDSGGNALFPGFTEQLTHEAAPDRFEVHTTDRNLLASLDDGTFEVLSKGTPQRKVFRCGWSFASSGENQKFDRFFAKTGHTQPFIFVLPDGEEEQVRWVEGSQSLWKPQGRYQLTAQLQREA